MFLIDPTELQYDTILLITAREWTSLFIRALLKSISFLYRHPHASELRINNTCPTDATLDATNVCLTQLAWIKVPIKYRCICLTKSNYVIHELFSFKLCHVYLLLLLIVIIELKNSSKGISKNLWWKKFVT